MESKGDQPTRADKATSAGRRTGLRFVLGFAVTMAVLEVGHLLFFVRSDVFHAYLATCARTSAGILNFFGVEATASGDQLSSGTGAVQVALGCEGIQPVILLIAAIVAFPGAHLKLRFLGVALGAAALLTLNLGRIIVLALITDWSPSAFDMMHTAVLPLALMAASMVFWLAWMRWLPPVQRAT